MTPARTADTILEEIKNTPDIERASNANWYLKKAEDLALSCGAEEDLLADLRSGVAQKKLDYMRSQVKRNISEVELWIETQPQYTTFRKQEAKVDQIKELIRVYKRTAESFMRGF